MIDLAIIGGGPAGLSAGLYATRGGIKSVVLFERGMPGGQITGSSEIENYPGVKDVVSGLEFMQPWNEQCFRFGLKHEMKQVNQISHNGEYFEIFLDDGNKQKAKAVIVCTGGTPRRSGVKGEDEFWGRGVSVCATCDGFFYKNKEVAVLGGGDTALEEAIYLTRMCKKVHLIHRRDEFRAAPVTITHAKHNPKINFITSTIIDEIIGDSSGVTGINISNLKTNQTSHLKVDGLFVFVGYDVNTHILRDKNGRSICDMNEFGQVLVDLNMKSSLPGLFAAGDIRVDALKQVVIAAGDGAVAALNAIEFLENSK